MACRPTTACSGRRCAPPLMLGVKCHERPSRSRTNRKREGRDSSVYGPGAFGACAVSSSSGAAWAAGSGWEIGTYTIDKISAAEKEFEKAGYTQRYMIDGIEFVIEPHFAKLLEGKSIDFCEGYFYTKGRENGI